jgi:short-subunit dehydrogenase
VLHLSQSLAAEWRASGVGVTCCLPGPVATGFAARGGSPGAAAAAIRQSRPRRAGCLRPRAVLCFPNAGARLRYAAFKLVPTQIVAASPTRVSEATR